MDKTDLQTDIDNGLSSYKIAKKYGKGQGTVRYWLKKYELKTKPTRAGYHFKYEVMDWNSWQKQHDSGMPWNKIKGYSNNAVVWAKENGKIKTKTISEAAIQAWETGVQKAAIYQTPEHRKKMSKFGGLKDRAGRCKKVIYTKKDGNQVFRIFR